MAELLAGARLTVALGLADLVVLDMLGAKAINQAHPGTRCPVVIGKPFLSVREMFRRAGIAGYERPVTGTGARR